MPYWEDPDGEKSGNEKCIEALDEIQAADELDDETNNQVVDVIKVCSGDIFTLFDIIINFIHRLHMPWKNLKNAKFADTIIFVKIVLHCRKTLWQDRLVNLP